MDQRGWHGAATGAGVIAAAAVLGGAVASSLLTDTARQVAVVEAATGSAGAVLATLTAYLLVRRMHRTLAPADVLLAAAVTTLALVYAVSALIPSAGSVAEPGLGSLPAALAGLVLVGGLLAAASAGASTRPASRADLRYLVVVLGGLVVVGGALMAGAGESVLERRVAAGLDALAALGALTAGAMLARTASRRADPVAGWLGVAAVVMAAAHAGQAISLLAAAGPAVAGGLIGLAGWVALLVAGARDFELAYRRQADAAVTDERRRLARELHDGLAQELAYISSETRHLSQDPRGRHLAAAAERALEESRTAILALSRPPDEPLERTISVAAHSIADRAGVDVTVAVRPGLDAPAEVRQALLRILREAMTNAVRHGRAAAVHVSVDGPSPLVLAVADDGDGFDADGPRAADCLGLQTMRERAENLGGRLSIETGPGAGTTVAVVVP